MIPINKTFCNTLYNPFLLSDYMDLDISYEYQYIDTILQLKQITSRE